MTVENGYLRAVQVLDLVTRRRAGAISVQVLGVNAVFHAPSAALVIDGRIVAAAEEERFSRRKHGKRPVPWSAWELPEQAMRWCLESPGVPADQLDAPGYSYDPAPPR